MISSRPPPVKAGTSEAASLKSAALTSTPRACNVESFSGARVIATMGAAPCASRASTT
ncbi:hypothetical protein OB2597_17892 [Pseudooceanicola batsensis HTCC2597]|uniref:Uncharacterized protein n=1 Tax=Pseudooceanicola batsensis (strain ATCC BAA-863 / DSM 15984 / KCTC 12145 / HTCC2597) TaxID=252305 RepID=A3TZY2_PSEBH|nr:hypothetical protein OB2597_17892 [Pseudooceanicola batsensis HTCC2597]